VLGGVPGAVGAVGAEGGAVVGGEGAVALVDPAVVFAGLDAAGGGG
jgi:hypothetical protein